MSFGLLTAVDVSDVPRIMRRIAETYRGVKTRKHKAAWIAAADLLDRYADEAEGRIIEIKRATPRERPRLDDVDDPPPRRARRARIRL